MQGHALGVDLGTSNTVAVLRWPDGRTRPLLFDGQPIMPSGVLLDPAGRLHVGRDAQRLAQADPARYEPNPKRHIDAPGVLLGDREIATVDLLAAALSAVAHAAVEAVGYLPPAAVTYPAAWGVHRRETLTQAVSRAGWPTTTRYVPEPVAAARYFADVLRRPVPVGQALAVFDFGGGTLDIAVVRNEGLDPAGRPRFAVVATGGVAELGGLDLDAALVEHLGGVVAAADPAAWERLRNPANAAQWRDRRRFWDDVRGAKEMLSRAAVAPVAVPGVEQAVHLTREELERLATPLLRRGVMETAAVIQASHLRPDQLAGLFLVGGSSRVPLVARLLHADLGIPPTVLEQPELPVAEGALAELAAPAPHVPVQAAAPVAVPVSAAPSTGIPASVSPPFSGGSAPPVSGAPAPPWSPPPAAPSRGVPRKAWFAAAAAAMVTVIAAVAVVVVILNRGGYDAVKFAAFADVGQPLPMSDRSYYVWTYVWGDRAYYAYQKEDDRLAVIAADATSGAKLWWTDVPDPADSWLGLRATPGVLLAYADAIGSTRPRKLSALSAEDGHRLWSIDLYGEDQTFVVDDRLVVVDRTNHKLVGYGLRDGTKKWELATPKDRYDDATTAVYIAETPKDLGGPTDAAGWVMDADLADDNRLVQIGADRSVRVVDGVTGKILEEQSNVMAPRDLVAVYDGQLFATPSSESTEVVAMPLDALDQRRTVYHAKDEQRRAIALAACGDKRVCVLENTNFDADTTELVSVPRDGGAEWRQPAAGVKTLLPVGTHVLLQTESPVKVVGYDTAGKRVLDRDGWAGRVNGASVLVFGEKPSTSVDDVNVVGVVLGADEPVQLGALTGVRAWSCSWNTSVIGCAGDTDFRLRRFAS